MVSDVIQILNQLVSNHEQLLELTTRKQKAIIHGDIELIRELVQSEALIIKDLNQVESERMNVFKSFESEVNKAQADTVTLSSYMDTLSESEDKEQIQHLTNQLTQIMDQLRYENDMNKSLTEDALIFNQQSIDLIAGIDDQPNYERPQQKQSSPAKNSRRLFDSQA